MAERPIDMTPRDSGHLARQKGVLAEVKDDHPSNCDPAMDGECGHLSARAGAARWPDPYPAHDLEQP